MPDAAPSNLVRRLLWIDGLGGLAAGTIVLLLRGWLSELHGLPQALIVFVAVTNLLYGTYATALARRRRRPLPMIIALAAANLGWLTCCVAMTWIYRESITEFGALHLLGEGLYVGVLGALEWRLGQQLADPSAR